MTDRFRVVPAAYVALLRDGPRGTEVLLQLRQNTGFRDGYWACAAAGHVERGETVQEAARREAREEIGIDVLDLEPWCAMQRTGSSGRPVDERVDYFFGCTAWSGDPSIREPEKNADLRWWPLAELPHPVVPHERVVLDAYRDGDLRPILVFGFESAD